MMRNLFTVVCLFMVNALHAQYTATWVLTSNKNVVVAGAQASGVSAGIMVPGATVAAGSHNTDGFLMSIPTGNWPTVPTDDLHMDQPFSPNGSVDVLLSSVTLTAKTSGSSGNNLISLAYQANGTGPWVAFGTPQVATSGGTSNLTFTVNQKFYAGNTYVIRMYTYAQGASTTSSRTVRIKSVVFSGTVISPAGTQPTVTTNTAVKTGKYSGNVTGTLTAGTLAITESGVVYNTTGAPTIANSKVPNGPLVSGAINSNITGLNAGITYYARAYATSESGNTVYGATLTFTTDPPVVPVLTTAAITNILSHKATSGGNITDSGGVAITAKGIVWKAGTNPTLADNKTTDGQWFGAYTSLMTGLTPSTNYCVRAYATNSIGTAYGNEVCFTTNPPTPIIVTTPANINFGGVIVNTNAPVQSYTLKASSLSPASGNITINAPAGFMISLSAGSGFASSLNIPYTGGAIGPITIYVSFNPTQYGAYSGTITHSGGGAVAINIDNVNVSGAGIQSPTDVSNMGTDFWVGYGYQALMSSSNNQEMVLYLSSKQDAVVTVEIPGTGYSQTYNVTANVALATNPLPKTGLADARLNSTGILNRAVHVYSNGIPIAVWGHIYASQSSGATMVLPVNTWGSDYSVLTTGGSTNTGVPHSFFFVMASEDNTVVDITPSADITSTAGGTTILYPSGVTFSVTLNKGQVFNALGKLNSSSNGVDLTGTKVKARDCKKIALFTGNGRVQLSVGGCSFTDGGSDNFIQQMFPKIAWGSTYLTVPFRDMEAGFLRVVVSDPATVVNVNGVALPAASLVNGLYYQVNTDTTNLITSDKPVMVAQYCATHKCNGTGLPTFTNTGNYGDPEMIILSPVQQAINDVSVFSATQYGIARNYINVIVKNAGVASFQLDGINVASQFKAHDKLAGYSYAVFTGLAGGVSHRLTSVEPFNAIAYGFTNDNDHESYGYNAGTFLKDLSTKMMVQNPYGLNNNATTCANNPFDFKVALPLLPANIISLTWNFNNNPNLSPNANVVQNAPVTSTGTITVDGNTLNVYTLTGPYTFNAPGTYPIKVIANATTADGCIGLREYVFDIIVRDNVLAEFTGNFNVCQGSSVTLTDASNGFGSAINQWSWNMGDGVGTATTQNVTYTYNTPGSYNVVHRAINDIGCYDDGNHTINVYAPPVASLTVAATPRCAGVPVTFNTTSTVPVGTIVKWTWNFGDAGSPTNVVVATTAAAQTHTYTNPGPYTVTLQVESNNGCISNIASQTFTVYRTTADFNINATPTCINTNVSFTDASSGNGSALTTWAWNFGAAGTSNIQNPAPVSFTTPGTVNVSLTATSAAGCVATTSKPVNVLATLAAPSINCVDSTFDGVTFGWSAVAGATGYQVSVNGGAFGNPSSGATGTTHQVTGMPANTSVSITVRALGTLACQQSSATVSCKTTLPVLEVFIPNTFTPNGDGKNDVFRVYNNYLQSVNMKIFNQWGELIFTSTDLTKGWDGTSKGKLQPVGVYVYVVNVELKDGTKVNRRGSINLIR